MSELHYVPNQWRVLTVEPEKGRQPDTFYVFRNPPNAAFANDEKGSRRTFYSYGAAQVVADTLNQADADLMDEFNADDRFLGEG